MDLELAYVFLKWFYVGVAGAALACLLIALVITTCTNKDATGFMVACITLAIFAVLISLPYGVVESKLFLFCPNCEKVVVSAFCPDCGWEAAGEQASVCSECGAEWDSSFCGDCGAKMDKE